MKKGILKQNITYGERIFFIIFVAFCFLFIRSLISFSENTMWRNDNFCELKYGATERGSEEFFGKYCAEVDYKNQTIIKHYYTHEEMMDYCGRTGFWELNKWSDKCS